MGFDWHTEEESSWPKQPQPRRRPVRLRRRWLLPLLSLVLIGALLFWWLHRQSKAAMAAVRADVLGSHTLVLDTAVRHDKELFTEQLDGQETTGWHEMQEALFDQVDLLDRWPFGLTLPASRAAPSAAAPSVTFTPELEMATVTFSPTYSVTAPELSQKEETVRLRHTFHYRLQADDRRWVLTEPPADFWGEERTFSGNWLTLTYPARDEALARRLGEASVSAHNFLIQQGLRPWPLLATSQNPAADAPLPLPRSVYTFCKGAGATGSVWRFDPKTAVESRQFSDRTFLAARSSDEGGLSRRLSDTSS